LTYDANGFVALNLATKLRHPRRRRQLSVGDSPRIPAGGISIKFPSTPFPSITPYSATPPRPLRHIRTITSRALGQRAAASIYHDVAVNFSRECGYIHAGDSFICRGHTVHGSGVITVAPDSSLDSAYAHGNETRYRRPLRQGMPSITSLLKHPLGQRRLPPSATAPSSWAVDVCLYAPGRPHGESHLSGSNRAISVNESNGTNRRATTGPSSQIPGTISGPVQVPLAEGGLFSWASVELTNPSGNYLHGRGTVVAGGIPCAFLRSSN